MIGRPPQEKPTYNALHVRLARRRGPAKTHLCVDCGARGAHWSYLGGDPDELIGFQRGCVSELRYSTNLDLYVVRCIPCHVLADRNQVACARGHLWADSSYIIPSTGKRRCKVCARAARVARDARLRAAAAGEQVARG